jgi:hypothetical protein
MQDTDDIGSNHSGNPHLQDLIDARMQRRSFLGGTLAVAATGFFGGAALAPTEGRASNGRGSRPRLGFDEVPVSS